MEQTQTDRTPLTHEIRKGFLNPIRDRIKALRDAMVKVIREQAAEIAASHPDGRIPIEETIVVRNDEYATIMVTAIETNKDGGVVAVLEDDMSNSEATEALGDLPLDILAQVIDYLQIDIPDQLIPAAEGNAEYHHILKAFEAARDTADALKDQLLAELGKTHDVIALDIAEPPSDEELERIYSADEVDHAICYKDSHDNICCFEEFASQLEHQGYQAVFSDGRVDYYIK